MKEKILAALKAKYKGLGFDAKTLDGMADLIAKNVTEESEVDQAVSDHDAWIKLSQAEADRRASAARKESNPPKTEGDEKKKKEDDETPTPGDDAPAWAKGLIKKIDEQAAEIASLKTGKTSETRRQKLENGLKDADEIFKKTILKDFDRLNFTDDNDFDEYLTSKVEESKEFVKNLNEQGLLRTPKPTLPGGNSTSKAIAQDIKDWADSTKAPAAAAKSE